MKPRFSIRDVMWLLVALGLTLGWGIDHWLTHSAMADLRGKLNASKRETQYVHDLMRYEEEHRKEIDRLRTPIPDVPKEEP